MNKNDHKFCAVNFLIVVVFRSCVRFSSFRYRFKTVKEWRLVLVFM